MKLFSNITRKKSLNTRKLLIPGKFCRVMTDVTKCSDSKHIEGFQYAACKYQCKNCHRFGHFFSLCYKKQESFENTWSRSPKAYQLTGGRLSTHDNSICSHSSDNSSSDESFCLQMMLQAEQANTKYLTPQHLFTNLEFKVKPHKNETKFLQARVDTCTDVNIMPVSIYKYLLKDLDCARIVPSNLQLGTYTNKKMKLLGSCNLYVIHPDMRCTTEVTFFLWPAMKAVSWCHAWQVLP